MPREHVKSNVQSIGDIISFRICNIYFHHDIRGHRARITLPRSRGWSGGAMVLGKLPVPGRPTILITVGQGPIALAVGAVGGGLDIFTLIYPFSSCSLSLGDGSI